MSLGEYMNRKGLPLPAAGCVILFATVVNEFMLDLIGYASFWGLLVGSDFSGGLNLNCVTIGARVICVF